MRGGVSLLFCAPRKTQNQQLSFNSIQTSYELQICPYVFPLSLLHTTYVERRIRSALMEERGNKSLSHTCAGSDRACVCVSVRVCVGACVCAILPRSLSAAKHLHE